MLTHRTNLLLEPSDYETLKDLSIKQKKTIGTLIRHAIRKTYKVEKEKTNKEIIGEIHKIASKYDFSGINWKEYIEEGRKY